jgi:ABC-2 type transport system ATP-binding protein
MDEVEILCDEICFLKLGKPVFQGTVADAIKQSNQVGFEDAYLCFTDEEVAEK